MAFEKSKTGSTQSETSSAKSGTNFAQSEISSNKQILIGTG
jgi:hypothetical protein